MLFIDFPLAVLIASSARRPSIDSEPRALHGKGEDMEEQEFQVGDIVQLKSGGPNMTVDAILKPKDESSGPRIRCYWFEEGKPKRYDDCFSPGALVLVGEELDEFLNSTDKE